MAETGQAERAARRAIARAKRRRSAEVTADDLLLGLLGEVSRFGIAWIGDWPIDVAALDGRGEEVGSADGAGEKGGTATPRAEGAARTADPSDRGGSSAPPPSYAAETVRLLERGAAIAREDGAPAVGLVHLLTAFGEVGGGCMEEIRRRHGFSESEWRAALARGEVGLAAPGDGARGEDGRGSPAAPGQPEILSVDDAAAWLGVHAQTVRNYIRSGKLPAYRLAGERYIRVFRRDLLGLLEPVRTEDPEEAGESA